MMNHMQLSKSQALLLLRLFERGGSDGIEWLSGRGPEGGRVNEGKRKYAAGVGLARKGLVTTTREEFTTALSGRTTHRILRLQLTAAGLAAAQRIRAGD